MGMRFPCLRETIPFVVPMKAHSTKKKGIISMKWQNTRAAQLAPLALMALVLADPSIAAETAARKKEKALVRMIQARDALIARLQQRVERLENRLDVIAAAPSTAPAAGMPVAMVAQAAPANTGPAQPATPSAPATARNDAPRAAPGSFEVDEDAAQRALERTLTQTGALLLPSGIVQVTPSLSYTRRELDGPFLAKLEEPVRTLIGSNYVLGTQKTRRNETTTRLDFKVGLPFESQLEFGLPYGHVGQKQVADFGPIGRISSSEDLNGVGDVTVGLAKTFAREKGWQPDLIGRLTYDPGNGKQLGVDNVVHSRGYRQLQAELVALKRQDPLAFVASASYAKVFERDSIKPGDAIGFSLAAVLAASPSTSLQFGFSQTFRQKQEQYGLKIAGTEQAYGVMSIGASAALTRSTMLNTQLGLGMGSDAPRYSFSVSLPIIFW